jgi:putative ABC transport system permease protein
MKYLPLVWASIMRKPARAILTVLSVMLAFTLFGLTIGMNATFDKVLKEAHDDRIFSGPRFGGTLPQALVGQISQIPGVSLVSASAFVGGYHQDPKNRVFVQMPDDKIDEMMPEWPVSRAEWDMLHKERTGMLVSRTAAERWKLKAGDNFTVVSPMAKKADGTSNWTFKVVAVTGDIDYMTLGYMVGNYDYYDQARPLAEQGKVGQLRIRSSDPAQTAALAQRIDNRFANSTTPLQSITEKAAFDVSSNTGMDIAAVDRQIAMAGMFMVLFLTANGIAQAVRERFAEFATLKTIGFSDTGVVALVFAEAAIPCLLGAGMGLGLAAVISNVMPYLLPPGQGLPIPTMTAMVFVWAGICASAVALVSAALPALRLKQMDIATALSGR